CRAGVGVVYLPLSWPGSPLQATTSRWTWSWQTIRFSQKVQTSTFDHGNGNSCGQQARHRSCRQQGRQQGDLGLPLSHIVRDSHGALKKGALSFVQGKKMPGKEWLATGSLARILDFREQVGLPPNDRAGIFPPQARLLPEARRADMD